MAGSLDCIVVTPEATACERTAESVVVPLFDGELGILPGHASLIGRLGFGELRITAGGQTESLYVDGGFVQVADDKVAILTPEATPLDQLDAAVAQEQYRTAEAKEASTPELQELRNRALQRARVQMRLARK